MTLPSFDLARPHTVAEACAMLADPESEVLAGGTQLLFAMKNGTRQPRRLVDVGSIAGLDSIALGNDVLTIGARVTLAHLAKHPEVNREFPVIVEAAQLVGTPQIQSMGTVAGNLCQDSCCLYVDRAYEQRLALPPCHKIGGHVCQVVAGSEICWANYAGDLAPVLIALGATVTIAGPVGERGINLREIFTRDGKRAVALPRGEFITEVRVPRPGRRSGAAYLKLRQRRSLEPPHLGVAAAISGGKATVVLTGVDRAPVVVEETDGGIESLAATASRAVRPVKNSFGYGPRYRLQLIRPFVSRAIREALRRAEVSND